MLKGNVPRGVKTRKVKKERKKKTPERTNSKDVERTAIQEVKFIHLLCNKQEKA